MVKVGHWVRGLFLITVLLTDRTGHLAYISSIRQLPPRRFDHLHTYRKIPTGGLAPQFEGAGEPCVKVLKPRFGRRNFSTLKTPNDLVASRCCGLPPLLTANISQLPILRDTAFVTGEHDTVLVP